MRAQLLIVWGILVAACSPTRQLDTPLPPIDPTRLSHEHHAQVPCGGCHRTEARPGMEDHKPCDDGACHRKEFLGAPGAFCQVCHTKVTPAPLVAPLKPFPVEDTWQTQPSRFSHKKHLDAGKMEDRVGFHVGCADCHVRDGLQARPDHATCARCHAAEVGLGKAPKMKDCTGCHEPGAHERTRARLIRDDLHFEHDRHKTDRKNHVIKCETCHTQTPQAEDYQRHLAPRVENCVTCHDDSDRTPAELNMRTCETCHAARTGTLTALAPRNHLPATERPLDHTLAFRRDHAEVAERDASRCATCHTRMSGNPRQACDECHQTMQPADHRITWRELDHGPESAANRERCARCHVVEFCSACHAQRPRSHGRFGSFTSEHGHVARINIRSCTACHGDRFCKDCHVDSVPRRRW